MSITLYPNSIPYSKIIGEVDTLQLGVLGKSRTDHSWYVTDDSPKDILINETTVSIRRVYVQYEQGETTEVESLPSKDFNIIDPFKKDFESTTQPYYRLKLGKSGYDFTSFVYQKFKGEGLFEWSIRNFIDSTNDPITSYFPESPKIQNIGGQSGSGYGNFIRFKTVMFSDENGLTYVGTVYCFTKPQGGVEIIDSNIYGEAICIQDLSSKIGEIDWIEKNDEYGDYSTSGGYGGSSYGSGAFDDSSDHIGVPSKPNLSISSLGFINVYSPTTGGLQGMVNELFPKLDDPIFPEVEGDGTLADISKTMKALGEGFINFSISMVDEKLLDYVLDTHIIPVSPEKLASVPIEVGFKTLTTKAPKIVDDYIDFDCGTVEIKEYYQNFIDYVGCRAQLYLPFVGFVPIKPELFQNVNGRGALRVVYRFNVLDGSFVAWVLSTSSKSKLTDTVVGSYSGNCCVHVPISAINYASMVSGLVSGIGAMSTALPTSTGGGNVGDALSGAMEIVNSKPTYTMSNGYNATSSYSGIRRPYLLIERQVASFSKNYASERGLPLNVTKSFENVHGFTIASNLVLDRLNCTSREKDEIRKLFASGVIL